MKPKTYKLDAAVELLAKHGFNHPSISEFNRDQNYTVTIHQDWTPRGKEIAVLKRARGRYRGNVAGVIYRENPVKATA